MDKFMVLTKVSHSDYVMFKVEMKNGKFPDEVKAVKEAMRRLLVFCQVTYDDGLAHLEWVYGGHPETEKELVNWITSGEWEELFRKDRKGRPIAFRGVLGESLAFWVARRLKKYPVVSPIRPGGSDPAFDLVALEKTGKKYAIRWIQAKGTDANYRSNCNLALRKFKKLEDGEYSAQVSNTLRQLALEAREQKVQVDHTELRRVQLDPSRRRYMVFVLHDSKLTGRLMTKYKTTITGANSRREAIFIQMKSVASLLKEMEAAIRASIS